MEVDDGEGVKQDGVGLSYHHLLPAATQDNVSGILPFFQEKSSFFPVLYNNYYLIMLFTIFSNPIVYLF